MSADGTWNVRIESPMGAQDAQLVLATEGSALTGRMTSPQGEIDITEGTVDGASLAWKAALTQPMPITLAFSATVDGDRIEGTATLGSFGSANFSGTRA
jgi:hypothetical protein